MINIRTFYLIPFFYFLIRLNSATAQTLTLKDAIHKGLSNYGTIKAKENYAKAAAAALDQSRREYLPNLVLSAQQDYGTINGQNGPLYGFGGYGVASAGAALPDQNWNAAFGALYLANINWDFFTFGRMHERIKISEAAQERDQNDLLQEQFQHRIRVAAAYLNLLASQRIVRNQEKNLERAIIFKTNTVTRSKNGLIAGVDSSLANAEVSNAKIALSKAKDQAQELAGRLAVLIGVPYGEFVLDTSYVNTIPAAILQAASIKQTAHPVLSYYQSRIDVSAEQTKYFRRTYFPAFSLVGVFQERGSGFEPSYNSDQTAFSTGYGTGVTPSRGNYLIGVGLNWNITTIARSNAQVRSQKFISDALQADYDLANQQLKAQSDLADAKIKNALDAYNEAPVQLKAATDAYNQKTVMYRNGLTTITEVTQTLYALNRAETDRDIAYTNVWQALLLKIAAAGDLTTFATEFQK